VPKRSRDRRSTTAPPARRLTLEQMQAQVAGTAERPLCPKLFHLAIASHQPPSVTPGCEDCARTYAIWEQMPKSPEPKPFDPETAPVDELGCTSSSSCFFLCSAFAAFAMRVFTATTWFRTTPSRQRSRPRARS
jgi:hypothetical protein